MARSTYGSDGKDSPILSFVLSPFFFVILTVAGTACKVTNLKRVSFDAAFSGMKSKTCESSTITLQCTGSQEGPSIRGAVCIFTLLLIGTCKASAKRNGPKNSIEIKAKIISNLLKNVAAMEPRRMLVVVMFTRRRVQSDSKVNEALSTRKIFLL